MYSCLLKGYALTLICALTVAAAEDPANYQLRLVAGAAPPGGETSISINCDNSLGQPVTAWSYGVCHDAQALSLAQVDNGANAAVIRGGNEPSFNSIHMNPAGGDGWTVGVVVDFFGTYSLTPGPIHELSSAQYTVLAPEGATTTVFFCETLGQPPVEVRVVAAGQTLVPFYFDTQVSVSSSQASFHFAAPNVTAPYHPDEGRSTTEAFIRISERSDRVGYPHQTQGFSVNIQNDASVITPTAIELTGEIMAMHLGTGPAFVIPNLFPGQATIGVIYAMVDPVHFLFEVPKSVVRLEYEAEASLLFGDTDGRFTRLVFTPPWANVGGPANAVVVNGQSVYPSLESGSIDFVPVLVPDYRRGDCNGDSVVNFADGIWLINQAIVPGAPQGTCASACDANDDGAVNLADCVYLFMFRFLGGLPPAPPYPDCGKMVGVLDCEAYRGCP